MLFTQQCARDQITLDVNFDLISMNITISSVNPKMRLSKSQTKFHKSKFKDLSEFA